MLQVPTVKKIDIAYINWQHAEQILSNIQWGEYPLSLNIKNINSPTELYNFLEQLYDFLLSQHIHPYFPYPIFINSQLIQKHPIFPIIHNEQEITYFLTKAPPPKGKEITHLQKIKVFANSIKNNINATTTAQLINYSQECKVLKDICQENYFFKKIITTWDK